MCREYAARQGWSVCEDHFYTDRELSGVGNDRPGWKKLWSAIELQERPFDVLLVDDTSRLSRNLGDSVRFADEMRFRNIRLIAVSQGVDTASEQSDVIMTIRALNDSSTTK